MSDHPSGGRAHVMVCFEDGVRYRELREFISAIRDYIDDPTMQVGHRGQAVRDGATNSTRRFGSGFGAADVLIVASSLAVIAKPLIQVLKALTVSFSVKANGRSVQYKGVWTPRLEKRLLDLLSGSDQEGNMTAVVTNKPIVRKANAPKKRTPRNRSTV